jgi:hypothetical protein
MDLKRMDEVTSYIISVNIKNEHFLSH